MTQVGFENSQQLRIFEYNIKRRFINSQQNVSFCFLVCGGEFTAPNGIISSPYHPEHYPHQRTCTYVISQPLKTIIRAEFLDFDIEGSQNCNYDYLEVRDGPDANSSFIGKFCGDPTMTPSPIVSTLNYLWFSFTTDASVTNRGFKVYLIQLKEIFLIKI